MDKFINPFADVALMNMRHKIVSSNDVRLIYLLLPYFTKEAEECGKNLERFIH